MATYLEMKFSDTRRQCMDAKGEKCFFHCWAEQRVGLKGVLEYQDGSIRLTSPDRFIFIDGGRFDEYVWSVKKGKTND